MKQHPELDNEVPIIAASFITKALAETNSETDPTKRRRAVRSWLQAQGFSKESIEESDAAIQSAIQFALPRNEPTRTPERKGRIETENLDLLSKSSRKRAVKDIQGSSAAARAAKTNVRPALWRPLILLFPLSVMLSFFVAPGVTPQSDFIRVLLTSTGISLATLLLGILLRRLNTSGFVRMISALIVLAIAPAYIFGVSLSERTRLDSTASVPTIFTEYGFSALPETITALVTGNEVLTKTIRTAENKSISEELPSPNQSNSQTRSIIISPETTGEKVRPERPVRNDTQKSEAFQNAVRETVEKAKKNQLYSVEFCNTSNNIIYIAAAFNAYPDAEFLTLTKWGTLNAKECGKTISGSFGDTDQQPIHFVAVRQGDTGKVGAVNDPNALRMCLDRKSEKSLIKIETRCRKGTKQFDAFFDKELATRDRPNIKINIR